jgi:hypothetical protein
MNSRDRILRTMDGQQADYAPLCHLLNTDLQRHCRGEREYLTRQLAMGMDAVAALPDPQWAFDPAVKCEVRRERRTGGHDYLHKVYHTPAGDLTTTVELTDDWPHGDEIPLMSDFVIPRGRKRLVTEERDLAPLSYLLRGPTPEAVEEWRVAARRTKALADELGIATRGAFNRLSDMVCWLCGCEEFSLLGMTSPTFFRDLLALVARWQERIIEVFLSERPDILVDAQWYATTFLSPKLYEEFLSPLLRRRVDMAHDAGARFCALTTTTVTPFFPLLKRLEVDAVFGVDPLQGEWDLRRAKAELGDAVTLWGGINGYLHIVDGTPEQVAAATEEAMRTLAPGGRFILAPVDNVRIDGPDTPAARQRVAENTQAMIDAWKRLRQ